MVSQKICVKWDGEILEEKWRPRRGVPQGCALAPLLYIISLELWIEKLREITESRRREDRWTLGAFADNIAVVVRKEE